MARHGGEWDMRKYWSEGTEFELHKVNEYSITPIVNNTLWDALKFAKKVDLMFQFLSMIIIINKRAGRHFWR